VDRLVGGMVKPQEVCHSAEFQGHFRTLWHQSYFWIPYICLPRDCLDLMSQRSSSWTEFSLPVLFGLTSGSTSYWTQHTKVLSPPPVSPNFINRSGIDRSSSALFFRGWWRIMF
jgi:hypothetical protein